MTLELNQVFTSFNYMGRGILFSPSDFIDQNKFVCLTYLSVWKSPSASESNQEIVLTKTEAKKTFVLSEASPFFFVSQKSSLSFSEFIQA